MKVWKAVAVAAGAGVVAAATAIVVAASAMTAVDAAVDEGSKRVVFE